MNRALIGAALVLALVDGTALPFGSAAAQGSPAVDETALPFGSAAARGSPAVDGTAHAEPSPIPADAAQLITGVTADWDATRVTLRRWKRVRGAWVADGSAWQGVVGKTGVAWGRGLHGDGAPAGHDGPVKREGDGKAPAGVFGIRGVYGYAAGPPPGTSLPYTQSTPDLQCVDDPASHHYTQLVDRTAPPFGGAAARGHAPVVDRPALEVDWTSAEAMWRNDALYTWVVDIAHNRAATPGAGSCIFFHVWRGPASVTVGCTAMAEPKLTSLIASLDASSVYVLLPRAEYDGLAAAWGLPRQRK